MSNITISGASGQVNITLGDQDPAVAVLLEQNADVTYEGSPGVGAVNGDDEAAWSITNLGSIAGWPPVAASQTVRAWSRPRRSAPTTSACRSSPPPAR